MTSPAGQPSPLTVGWHRYDFGGGRSWQQNGDHPYGWLLGADGQTYGYPLSLEEARDWITDEWPPTTSQACITRGST